MSRLQRGAFLVFEGCDRSGKSTQCEMLLKALEATGVKVKHIKFPERNSVTGKIINDYLKSTTNLSDEAIHLLFSANRWEIKNEMAKLLEDGTTLIVDRYLYSGVAYSWAKGLQYEWCVAPERGLIRPDAVFYLKTDASTLESRGSFGEERYEKVELQKKVSSNFDQIYDNEKDYWHTVNAGGTVKQISDEILEKAVEIIRKASNEPLKAF